MNSIKVFACDKAQVDLFVSHLRDIVRRSGKNSPVEGHFQSGLLRPTMIHGVDAKDFPVISINNCAVWQTTLPPEDEVLSWLTWPDSVDEAVDLILDETPAEKLKAMLSDPVTESLLGQGIRNGFGLWTGNDNLRLSCGSEDIDADEASQVIIEALKTRLSVSPPSDHQTSSSENIRKKLDSAGKQILMWSFNMACEIEPVIREKHPQIQTYTSATLFNDLLQAATIISSMLRIERRLGPDDYTAFHKDVVQNIAPSVRNRYMPAMQALLSFLLRVDQGTISPDELPAFGRLLSGDETKVANSIAYWLVWSMKTTKPDLESDTPLLVAIQQSVYSLNADFIAEIVLKGK